MTATQLTLTRYSAPFGPLTIVTGPAGLKYLTFSFKEKKVPDNHSYNICSHMTSSYSREVLTQLEEYFAGHRRKFNLTLDYHGTSFQKSVWSALQEIPYGTTCSYSDIARAIGKPRSYRAVGQAIHQNPVSIIIPCHRVIGKNGKLVGFAGGLSIKKWLLDFEKQVMLNQTASGR